MCVYDTRTKYKGWGCEGTDSKSDQIHNILCSSQHIKCHLPVQRSFSPFHDPPVWTVEPTGQDVVSRFLIQKQNRILKWIGGRGFSMGDLGDSCIMRWLTWSSKWGKRWKRWWQTSDSEIFLLSFITSLICGRGRKLTNWIFGGSSMSDFL